MQNFLSFHETLKESPELKKYYSFMEKVCQKHRQLTANDFSKTKEFQFLRGELNKLQVKNIKERASSLPTFDKMIAFVLTNNNFFTLAFIMMPKGKIFKWHDHIGMNGLTKCGFGRMDINSLDVTKIQVDGQKMLYSKSEIKTDALTPEVNNNTSIICPQTFNIHEIKAIEQSGFFDFMLPNYPKDNCTYYQTVSESQDLIQLKKKPADFEEDVISLTKYIKSE